MKKIKKISIIFLTVITLLSCALLVSACNKDDTTREEIDSDEKHLSVAVKEYDVIVGDEATVSADYQTKEGKVLAFSSANEKVAEVDENGRITANGIGETTIKVTYGEEEVTVSVKVGLGDLVPTLIIKHISQEKFTMTVGEEIEISPKVSFNGKEFSPDEISLTQTNDSVADISGGVIKPKGKGDTKVTLSCKWQGREFSTLKRTFKITAINRIELLINDGSDFSDRVLYPLENFDGNEFATSEPFAVKAFMNGKEVSPAISVVSGKNLLDYSAAEEKISVSSAREAGTAVVRVEFSGFNETYTKDINVIIKPCFGTYRGEAVLFSLADGDLPTELIFGSETEIVSAEYADGSEIEVVAGKITGIAVENEDLGKDLVIRAYGKSCGYELTIKPYTKVIKTAQDFAYFSVENVRTAGTATKGYSVTLSSVFDGYYIVANDIDATGFTHQLVKDAEQNQILNGKNGAKLSGDEDGSRYGQLHMVKNLSGGLTGVFDGNGHTISNLTVLDQGLFGIVCGGEIKNVAFENVTLKGSAYQRNTALFAQHVKNSTISDVYVKANTMFGGTNTKDGQNDAGGNRALISITLDNTNVSDCLFDYEIANTEKQYAYSYGLFCCESNFFGGHSTSAVISRFQNVYVVSDEPLLVQNNSLVLKKANTHVMLAENEVGEGTDKWTVATSLLSGRFYNSTESENALNDNYIFVMSGVKRYTTAEEMKNAGNDYSSFNAAYWSVENGVLSFR